jgi:hypothetical protein
MTSYDTRNIIVTAASGFIIAIEKLIVTMLVLTLQPDSSKI